MSGQPVNTAEAGRVLCTKVTDFELFGVDSFEWWRFVIEVVLDFFLMDFKINVCDLVDVTCFAGLGLSECTIELDIISISLLFSFSALKRQTDIDDLESICKRLAGGYTPSVSTIFIGETIVSELTCRFFPFVALGIGVG